VTSERLFDAEAVACPFPYFGDLREGDPIHLVDDSGVFLVTRMDLIKEIVADTDTFSNHYVGFLQRDDDGNPYVLPLGRGDESEGLFVLATADPPDHARHRRVVQSQLSAGAIEALVPTMRAFAEELLADGLRRGHLEWMSECAELLPLRVLARFMGLGESAIPQMLEFGYASIERIGGLASRVRLAELDEIAFNTAGQFVLDSYLGRGDGDDERPSLVGDIVAAVRNGDIDEIEAMSMLAVIVSAGGESTTSLIGTATYLFAREAGIQQQLRETRVGVGVRRRGTANRPAVPKPLPPRYPRHRARGSSHPAWRTSRARLAGRQPRP